MERAFQTALWLLKPEIVFILGDIFDEGKWSSQKVTSLSLFCNVFVMMMMKMRMVRRRRRTCAFAPHDSLETLEFIENCAGT